MGVMKRYDLEELSRPETYQADEALATLVQRVVAQKEYEAHGRDKMGRGEFKQALLSGRHPELVKPYVDQRAAEDEKRAASMEAGREAVAALELPDGYSVRESGEVPEDHVLLAGPFDDDLHRRLKRLGAHWVTKTGWGIPLEKGKSLRRVIANWRKAVGGKSTKEHRREAERWLGYVEEKAGTGYLYAKGVDRLQSLNVEQWPDLAKRLADAKREAKEVAARQREARARSEAERWLGYVESAAEEGRRYDKGVAHLRKILFVDRWPDLVERLETALERASENAAKQPSRPRKGRVLFPLSASPRLDHPVRHGGEIVVFEGHGKTFRIHEDHPSVHGAHLLGHEGEMGAYFYYRPATDEERARCEAEQARAQRRQQALERLDRIARRIEAEGEYPEPSEPVVLEGERVEHPAWPFDIHGSGRAFARTDRHIYFIRNNGMDGDDWSRNNIRTGGAGAMGWRVPFDPALWDQIVAARQQALDGHGENVDLPLDDSFGLDGPA